MNLLKAIILALMTVYPAFSPELADGPNADRVVMMVQDDDHEWTEAEVEAHADAHARVIVVDVD